ncbi:hypothetical protein IMCC3317_25820 [Kordia antarctica]|uniref:Uncharacterized protein n=1 Tax=Kordia antarctica TaxID=1218801 RepID=A0A7L4ZMS4_9FLAO|nr:hypothetical protein [Kordia antarctica]QHI37204.1 hypothetical protein IMCC3317_25820 [Kordia antarctica]
MKKQHLKNLSLRKREISNLNFTTIQGGKRSVKSPCATQTEYPTCNGVSIKIACVTQTEFPTCRDCV